MGNSKRPSLSAIKDVKGGRWGWCSFLGKTVFSWVVTKTFVLMENHLLFDTSEIIRKLSISWEFFRDCE